MTDDGCDSSFFLFSSNYILVYIFKMLFSCLRARFFMKTGVTSVMCHAGGRLRRAHRVPNPARHPSGGGAGMPLSPPACGRLR